MPVELVEKKHKYEEEVKQWDEELKLLKESALGIILGHNEKDLTEKMAQDIKERIANVNKTIDTSIYDLDSLIVWELGWDRKNITEHENEMKSEHGKEVWYNKIDIIKGMLRSLS